MNKTQLKEQLRTIYWFLNNTTGEIQDFQLTYLFRLVADNLDLKEREIKKEDLDVLNDFIERGNHDDLFINYILNDWSV
ncbi:MAG: hypothetical protein IJH20_06685 [Bacilli bacterium]|nr:hypothetical protein [Bacilli bacterium]